jgi:hypothetical protein
MHCAFVVVPYKFWSTQSNCWAFPLPCFPLCDHSPFENIWCISNAPIVIAVESLSTIHARAVPSSLHSHLFSLRCYCCSRVRSIVLYNNALSETAGRGLLHDKIQWTKRRYCRIARSGTIVVSREADIPIIKTLDSMYLARVLGSVSKTLGYSGSLPLSQTTPPHHTQDQNLAACSWL